MSLRIRRGLDADRLTKTFDEGEIAWTTDGKKLYVGDGTTVGGIHVLAYSVAPGSGLSFNSTTGQLGFNLGTLNLATQIVPESYVTTYTASGSSGTTLKVASTIGIQSGMTINGNGFTTQTVSAVVDGTTLTISAAAGNSPAPTNGQSLTFSSTNQYFTSARTISALQTALGNGTQSGISFNFGTPGAISATVNSAFPANASGVLSNNGSGTLSWVSLSTYAPLTSPSFTTPNIGAATATSLTSAQSTFNLLTSVATTVNAFTAANTIAIGSASSVTSFNGDVSINAATSADLSTTTPTASVFNTTATTLNIGGAATAISIGAGTGTTTVNNGLTVTGNLTVNGTTTAVNTETGTTISASNGFIATGAGTYTSGVLIDWVTNNTRLSAGANTGFTFYNSADTVRSQLAAISSGGNLSIAGNTLSSSSTTVNLFNATTTTLNIGGAATAINIGLAGGTTTIAGHLVVEGTTSTGSTGSGGLVFGTTPTIANPSITTSATTTSTTFSLINTIATTVNAFGAATVISIGANTGGTNSIGGVTTINNQLSTAAGITTAGTGIITTSSPFSVFNTNATQINAYGAATTIYEGAAGVTKYYGAATGNTTISLLGNTSAGTATITSNVTTGIANVFTGVTGAINIGATGSTVYHANISRTGLDISPANYITVSSTASYALSTTTTDNILIVTTGSLTATLTFPPSPVDGQRLKISVTTNNVTLALTAGPTLVGTFAGAFTAPQSVSYVYRSSNTTWYRA